MRNLRALLAALLVCLPFASPAQVVPPGLCQGKACGIETDPPLVGNVQEVLESIEVGAPAPGSVLPSHLDALDSASDEECVTFENSSGQFEWQACGSGASNIILDLADDGANESSGITEIAITNGSALCTEPADDKLLCNFDAAILLSEINTIGEANGLLDSADYVHRTTTPTSGLCAQWLAGGELGAAAAACVAALADLSDVDASGGTTNFHNTTGFTFDGPIEAPSLEVGGVPLKVNAEDGIDLCRGGTIRGGGYNGSTYAWTCGNFDWSGLTATVTCIADGNPDTACLYAGETLQTLGLLENLYMAAEATRPNGRIYLPEGIYLYRGCSDATCPFVEQSAPIPNANAGGTITVGGSRPGQTVRYFGAYKGLQIFGAGQDPDGPLRSGRTGTYLVDDSGPDVAGTAAEQADDDGELLGDRVFRVGLRFKNICYSTDLGGGSWSRACVPSPAGVTTDQMMNLGAVGRGLTLLESFDPSDQASQIQRACVDNRVSTTGVCSDDLRILCTSTTGGRLTNTTGDCVFSEGDLGPCIPVAQALDQAITNGERPILGWNLTGVHYDDVTDASSGQEEAYTPVIDVTATTCATNGVQVNLGIVEGLYNRMLPFERKSIDPSDVVSIDLVNRSWWEQGETYNYNNLSFMPAQWYGRDISGQDSADCDAGSETSCDSAPLVGSFGSYGGGFNNVAFHYCSHDGQKSCIDGDQMAVRTKFHHFTVADARRKLVADSSNWDWKDGIFRDNVTTSGPILTVFTGWTSYENIDFINNTAQSAMLYAVSHRGLSAKDLRFISNRAGHGIFYIFRGAFSSISDITIVGGVGHAILFAPTTNDTLAHWRFDNWRIYGGLNVPPDASGSTARYKSVIAISEHLDTLQGSLRDITFSNFVVDTTEANTCLVSVDIGDDNTLAGANTALEDDLAQVSILNSSLRVPTAGAIVCLGNDESASPFYDASNSAGVLQHSSASQAWAATRYLPRLEGNSINGVPMADQKQRAVAAAQVPDGDGLPPGITVLINDDTAENDCTDATANGTLDGGGTAVSACIWNGTTWVGL